jgi:hypothetical protein
MRILSSELEAAPSSCWSETEESRGGEAHLDHELSFQSPRGLMLALLRRERHKLVEERRVTFLADRSASISSKNTTEG